MRHGLCRDFRATAVEILKLELEDFGTHQHIVGHCVVRTDAVEIAGVIRV